MPLLHLDTVVDVSITNWSVYGTTVPAYQAIRKASGDSTGVAASLRNASAIFQCNHGEFPSAGLVGPFRIYCRHRLSDPTAVGAILRFIFRIDGVDRVFGSVVSTGAWTLSSVEYRKAIGTSRVPLIELQDLTLRLLLVSAPSAGTVEVSELWLEEETATGLYRYDAAEAVLPEAVVGPLNWTAFGGYPAVIVSAGENYLEIHDTSLVDGRIYGYTVDPAVLKPGYSTHLETRFSFPGLISADGGGYIPLAYMDNSCGITLAFFIDGPTYYLGLINTGAAFDDRNSYLALEPWPGGITTSTFYHISMDIRRSRDLNNPGRVEVFVEHATTPLLSALYLDFAPNVLAPLVYFGTLFPKCVWVWIDYVTFQTVREFGAAFAHWDQLEGSANSVVSADSTDVGICKLTPLTLLPDVVAGQSNYACKLTAAGTPPCAVRQIFLAKAAPVQYALQLEYSDDTTDVAPLRVALQRFSDLFYWDEGAGAWTDVATYADLLHSATRTIAVASAGFSVATQQSLIITLSYNLIGPPMAPPHIWIYRVYLAEI